MKLKEALKNFYINEVRILYKHDTVLLRNPTDIKLYEEEDGLIGIDSQLNTSYFVFIILKKDVDYRERSHEIHRLYETNENKSE